MQATLSFPFLLVGGIAHAALECSPMAFAANERLKVLPTVTVAGLEEALQNGFSQAWCRVTL